MSGVLEHKITTGGIVSIGRRQVSPHAPSTKSATHAFGAMSRPSIEGWACVYGRVLYHDGHYVMFSKSAFTDSLASGREVRMELGHHDDQVIGSTANRLELRSDDRGLAFRYTLRDEDDDLARKVADLSRAAVSVGCNIEEAKQYDVDGDKVRLVTRARLIEVSLVGRPAVRQAFARVIDATKSGPLIVEMKSKSFDVDSAYGRLMRTLKDTL